MHTREGEDPPARRPTRKRRRAKEVTELPIDQQALEFTHYLPVPTGPLQGQRIELDPFQVNYIRDVYGPHDDRGERIVQSAVLSTARRNGKSLLMAVLVLLHLCGPLRRLNSRLFSAANDRFQAAVVFDLVAAIIRMQPRLQFLGIIESTKRIINPRSNSMYMAISAEAVTKLGQGPDVVVYDELGAARNRRLYDVLVSSQGATKSPIMHNISTQAQSRSHLLSELIDYGLKAKSLNDPSFVCHLHSAKDKCDLLDEAEWYRANPALGKWRNLAELRTKANQAYEMPAQEPMFRNLYLNQRVDALSPMIAPAVWDACAGQPDLDRFKKGKVYGGLDLSTKNDLSALALVTRDEFGLVHAICIFWTPEDGLREREQRDAAPYSLWVKQGLLKVTPGRVVRYDYIVHELADALIWMEHIEAIHYDRWGIDRFKQTMLDEGIDFPMTPCGQGFKDMGACVIALEDILLSQQLRHGDHPVLTMCASNAVAETNPVGQRKFSKHKATGRIDGMVALAMACGALIGAESREPTITLL